MNVKIMKKKMKNTFKMVSGGACNEGNFSLLKGYNFDFLKKKIIIIIIINIIIRHQLDLNRPLLASSDTLFKGVPSRLDPFRL